MQPNNKKPSYR